MLARQYEIIVILNDADLHRTTLWRGLGWRVYDRHDNGAQDGTQGGLPDDLEQLWAVNWLDAQLHRFASVLARLDSIVYGVAEVLEGLQVGWVRPRSGGCGGGRDEGYRN